MGGGDTKSKYKINKISIFNTNNNKFYFTNYLYETGQKIGSAK